MPRRLLVFLAVLVVALAELTGSAASASSGSIRAYVYDAATIPCIAVHEMAAAKASPAQLRDVRDEYASPHVEVRGTFTTSSRALVATNTAGSAFNHTTDQAVDSIMRSGLSHLSLTDRVLGSCGGRPRE